MELIDTYFDSILDSYYYGIISSNDDINYLIFANNNVPITR